VVAVLESAQTLSVMGVMLSTGSYAYWKFWRKGTGEGIGKETLCYDTRTEWDPEIPLSKQSDG
jgi:hypothetical protein